MTRNNQLLVGYIFTYLFNCLLKNAIFKPLMRDAVFPLLGSGLRPPGAKNCGLWSSEAKPSYGMPSGHSQLITFFLTSQLLDNSLTRPAKNLLIPLSLYLLYTRVELGCHTWQQVIVGALFGILSYFLFEKIWDIIENKGTKNKGTKNKGTNNKETTQ
jgi:membrane-associated phospholipid phosphatase